MTLSELLGAVYSKAEGAFYGIMDFLDGKGLPVYSVIDPLEERGIPVFPIIVALLIIAAALIYLLVLTSGPQIYLRLDIRDEKGAELRAAEISIKDMQGNQLKLEDSTLSHGEKVLLTGARLGTTVAVTGRKEGYLEDSVLVQLKGGNNDAPLVLKRDLKQIVGRIMLQDAATGDLVSDATIKAVLGDGRQISCIKGEESAFECIGVGQGEEVMLIIKPDNYEEKQETTTFTEGTVKTITLSPKPSTVTGNSNLIIRVKDAETGQLLGGSLIKIYETGSEEPITSIVDDDGEYVETIKKGSSIRIVLSKEGYLIYDSNIEGSSRTIRAEEELWEVQMKRGGNSITVNVTDLTGLPLTNAKVQLFNSEAVLLESKKTDFSGQVSFGGLDAASTYYVTAFLERYLPRGEEVRPAEKQALTLELEFATMRNSAQLEVLVAGEDNTAANNAALSFFEIAGSKKLPLGIPQQYTDLSGKYSGYMPLGKKLLVEARKGAEAGDANILIEQGRNEVLIKLSKPAGLVALTLLDASGKQITGGKLHIESPSGNLSLDTNVGAEPIYFDAAGINNVRITYTAADGSSYTEEINVEKKGEITVTVKPEAGEGMTPKIEFLGMFTVAGENVDAIHKDEDYYAKFSVTFPEGKHINGVHMRVGPDSVKYADSQDIVIRGFSAPGAGHFYGRTYTPEPAPGFEGIDMQNVGAGGAQNKWLELYFDSGGSKIIKLRVQAKETATKNEFEVHYRAWTIAAGAYYRAPLDQVLGHSEFNEQRSALYAETYLEKIRLFGAKASCEKELCASYKFIRADGSEYEAETFRAIKGESYALEIELNPSKDITATIKGSTSKTNPKLYFTGYGINNFAEFPDNDRTDTSIEVTSILVEANQAARVRLYFKTIELENTSITTQVITGETVLTETFYFNTYLEKNMLAKTEPEFISIGQDFAIIVNDEEGPPIGNASIRITRPSGEIVRAINGDNSKDNGLGGTYLVKNSLDAGTYKIEIKAEGFRPVMLEISIAKTGVLKIPPEIGIIIPKDAGKAEARFRVENTSQERIQNISFEIRPKANWPQDMLLTGSPMSYLDAKSSQYAGLTAEYAGEAKREHGEAELAVTGMVLGKYPVVAEAKVVASYNPELAGSCLEFSKEKLVAYLIGEAGSTKEIYLTIKNNCNLELTLTPEIIPKGKKDEHIKIETGELTLQPAGSESSGVRQDSEEIRIDITNDLQRNYPKKTSFGYDIFFKSDSITKSIPLEVIIWDKKFALQINRNIELWLGTVQPGQPPQAAVPLFISNIGEVDIEQLSFAISSAQSRGNVELRIEPSAPIALLKKGQALQPPPVIIATALRTEKATLHDLKEVVVKGTIDNKQYDFGPVWINTHISPPECLQAFPNTVEFRSSRLEEAISQEITIRNACAEDVKIMDADPKQLGSNSLTLVVEAPYLAVNQETRAQLILTKREAWSGPPQPLFIKGFLLRSNSWTTAAPINLAVMLGKSEEEAGFASEVLYLNVCGEGEGRRTDRKAFSFPRIALTNNCDSAYCDAESLANFIVERIESKVKDAKRQVQNYNSEVMNAPNCDPRITTYCTFARLGVKTESTEVYFMNDNLSAAMLRDVVKNKSTELKNFRVDFVGYSTAPGQMFGGYGNQIFMNSLMQGCGKYRLRIDGAVLVQGTRLMPDYVNILVNLYPEGEEGVEEKSGGRQLTAQCLPKIQNVMNFLPIDKSYSPQKSLESWLGLVESEEKELDELGEEFAQNLFGSKERFVSAVTGSNGIVLRKGVEQGYIMKIEMERSEGSAKPMNVYANIMEAAGQRQKEVAKEAAKAIKELRNNVIDGCISPNEDYFLIKSAKEIGELGIEMKKAELNVHMKEECADFNVFSDVRETVNVSAKFKGERQGIEEPYIKTKKGDAKVNSAELSEKDNIRNRFYAELKLCAKGSKDIHLVQGKKVVIEAESKQNKQRKASKEVTLQLCGMHPYALLEELAKKEKGSYYARLIWKNPPEEINIDELGSAAKFIERQQHAENIAAGKEKAGKAGLSPEAAAELKATLWGYLPACTATATLISLFRGLGVFGAVPRVFMSCIVPAGWKIASTWEPAALVKDSLAEGFKGLAAFIPQKWKDAAKEILQAKSLGILEKPKKDAPEIDRALVEGAIFGTGAYSLAKGLGARPEGASILFAPLRPSVLISFAKEIVAGGAANIAGLAAYNAMYKRFSKDSKASALDVGSYEGKGLDLDGDGKPDAKVSIKTTGKKLNKYSAYIITLDTAYGGKELDFTQADAPPEDMKKENIIEKCGDASFNEGVLGALPTLLPEPDKPPKYIDGARHANHVIAYLRDQDGVRYGALIAHSAKEAGIKEALLVTAAIWKSDFGVGGAKAWITGCKYGDSATKAPEDSFKCAAQSFAALYKSCDGRPTDKDKVICTLKEYNKVHKVKDTSDEDYGKLYGIYEKWNSFAW